MTLRDTLEARGNWLFRYRGHLPLLLLPLFVAALAGRRPASGAGSAAAVWEALCLALAFAGVLVRILTGGLVFVVCRFLKKHTRVLRVPGR